MTTKARLHTLAADLRRAGVTHLHAHWATQPATVALLVKRIAGIPFSLSAHAYDIYIHLGYRDVESVERSQTAYRLFPTRLQPALAPASPPPVPPGRPTSPWMGPSRVDCFESGCSTAEPPKRDALTS